MAQVTVETLGKSKIEKAIAKRELEKVGIEVVTNDIKRLTRQYHHVGKKEYMLVIAVISKKVQHAYFKDMATGEILAAKKVLDTYTLAQ